MRLCSNSYSSAFFYQCRLIVSQMSSTRCEVTNWLLVPLAFLVLAIFNVEAARRNEAFLLRVITVLITLAHVHYGVCVVRQMCHHFRINCFSLTKRPGYKALSSKKST